MARPKPAWRRRYEAQLLRYQARLEGPTCDRILPWVLAGLLFAVLFGLSQARAHSLGAGQGLAAAVQTTWLIGHGMDPYVTVSDTHVLAQQFPLALYVVAWLTRVVPAVPVLLAVQAAGVAMGIVPLWRMARSIAKLRVGAAFAITVAYACSPALVNVVLNDFHTATVAVGPMLFASYYALRHEWRWCLVAGLFTAVWSAELALVIAGVGALAVWHGNRRGGIRIVVAGLAWAGVALLWLEGRYGSTGFIAPGAFEVYGDGAFSVIVGMVRQPWRVLGDVFAEPNLELLIVVFSPLLFLPILAPKYLLPAMPLQALYLVGRIHSGQHGWSPLVLPIAAFGFVAATFALQRIGRLAVQRVVVDRRLLIALTAAAIATFSVTADASPYERPWDWGRRTSADLARLQAIDAIAADARVRASDSVLYRLADRQVVYPVGETADAAAVGHDVEVVVLDAAQVGWAPTEWFDVTAGLVGQGFRIVYQAEGVTRFDRG